jgi:hypothetical protein
VGGRCGGGANAGGRGGAGLWASGGAGGGGTAWGPLGWGPGGGAAGAPGWAGWAGCRRSRRNSSRSFMGSSVPADRSSRVVDRTELQYRSRGALGRFRVPRKPAGPHRGAVASCRTIRPGIAANLYRRGRRCTMARGRYRFDTIFAAQPARCGAGNGLLQRIYAPASSQVRLVKIGMSGGFRHIVLRLVETWYTPTVQRRTDVFLLGSVSAWETAYRQDRRGFSPQPQGAVPSGA